MEGYIEPVTRFLERLDSKKQKQSSDNLPSKVMDNIDIWLFHYDGKNKDQDILYKYWGEKKGGKKQISTALNFRQQQKLLGQETLTDEGMVC